MEPGRSGPLGLAAFALTTFVLSTFNAGLVSKAGEPVLGPPAAAFFLLGIGNSGKAERVIEAGGWFGLATAVAAWYASFAAVTNSTFGRTVLPVRPLNR